MWLSIMASFGLAMPPCIMEKFLSISAKILALTECFLSSLPIVCRSCLPAKGNRTTKSLSFIGNCLPNDNFLPTEVV